MDKVTDYILRLKLDAKTLERDYPKVFAKLNKAQVIRNKQFKAEQATLKANNRERMASLNIDKKQERLRAKIQRAEEAGVRRLDKYKQMAKSRRPDVLGQADIGLSSKIRRNRSIGGSEQLGVDIAHERRMRQVSNPQLKSQLGSKMGQLDSLSERLKTAKTTEEVRRLRKEFSGVKREITSIEREQARFNRTLGKSSALTNKFTSSLKHAALGVASVYAVFEGAKAVFTIGKNMDSMKAGLLAASSSAEEAASNFQFLKDTSMKLGTDIETGVGAFNRLAVAARGAGKTTEDARHIYLAAAEASTTFGLSADKQSLVMLAFSQMMSKAKISSEEISKQLSEVLPVTLAAAAEATGKTTTEFTKLMTEGKIMSKDFMVPFATAIRKSVRDNGAFEASLKKVNAAFGRFKNTFKFIIDEAFTEGVGKSLVEIFGKLTKFVQGIGPAFIQTFVVIARVIEVVVDVLSTLNNILASNDQAMDGTIKKAGILMRVFYGIAAGVMYLVTGIYTLLAAFEELDNILDFNGAGNKIAAFQDMKANDPEAFKKELMKSSMFGSSSSKATTNNVNVTVNAKSSDPKGIAKETHQAFLNMVAQ